MTKQIVSIIGQGEEEADEEEGGDEDDEDENEVETAIRSDVESEIEVQRVQTNKKASLTYSFAQTRLHLVSFTFMVFQVFILIIIISENKMSASKVDITKTKVSAAVAVENKPLGILSHSQVRPSESEHSLSLKKKQIRKSNSRNERSNEYQKGRGANKTSNVRKQKRSSKNGKRVRGKRRGKALSASGREQKTEYLTDSVKDGLQSLQNLYQIVFLAANHLTDVKEVNRRKYLGSLRKQRKELRRLSRYLRDRLRKDRQLIKFQPYFINFSRHLQQHLDRLDHQLNVSPRKYGYSTDHDYPEESLVVSAASDAVSYSENPISDDVENVVFYIRFTNTYDALCGSNDYVANFLDDIKTQFMAMASITDPSRLSTPTCFEGSTIVDIEMYNCTNSGDDDDATCDSAADSVQSALLNGTTFTSEYTNNETLECDGTLTYAVISDDYEENVVTTTIEPVVDDSTTEVTLISYGVPYESNEITDSVEDVKFYMRFTDSYEDTCGSNNYVSYFLSDFKTQFMSLGGISRSSRVSTPTCLLLQGSLVVSIEMYDCNDSSDTSCNDAASVVQAALKDGTHGFSNSWARRRRRRRRSTESLTSDGSLYWDEIESNKDTTTVTLDLTTDIVASTVEPSVTTAAAIESFVTTAVESDLSTVQSDDITTADMETYHATVSESDHTTAVESDLTTVAESDFTTTPESDFTTAAEFDLISTVEPEITTSVVRDITTESSFPYGVSYDSNEIPDSVQSVRFYMRFTNSYDNNCKSNTYLSDFLGDFKTQFVSLGGISRSSRVSTPACFLAGSLAIEIEMYDCTDSGDTSCNSAAAVIQASLKDGTHGFANSYANRRKRRRRSTESLTSDGTLNWEDISTAYSSSPDVTTEESTSTADKVTSFTLTNDAVVSFSEPFTTIDKVSKSASSMMNDVVASTSATTEKITEAGAAVTNDVVVPEICTPYITTVTSAPITVSGSVANDAATTVAADGATLQHVTKYTETMYFTTETVTESAVTNDADVTISNVTTAEAVTEADVTSDLLAFTTDSYTTTTTLDTTVGRTNIRIRLRLGLVWSPNYLSLTHVDTLYLLKYIIMKLTNLFSPRIRHFRTIKVLQLRQGSVVVDFMVYSNENMELGEIAEASLALTKDVYDNDNLFDFYSQAVHPSGPIEIQYYRKLSESDIYHSEIRHLITTANDLCIKHHILNLCRNGGYCIVINAQALCRCVQGWEGDECQLAVIRYYFVILVIVCVCLLILLATCVAILIIRHCPKLRDKICQSSTSEKTDGLKAAFGQRTTQFLPKAQYYLYYCQEPHRPSDEGSLMDSNGDDVCESCWKERNINGNDQEQKSSRTYQNSLTSWRASQR